MVLNKIIGLNLLVNLKQFNSQKVLLKLEFMSGVLVEEDVNLILGITTTVVPVVTLRRPLNSEKTAQET